MAKSGAARVGVGAGSDAAVGVGVDVGVASTPPHAAIKNVPSPEKRSQNHAERMPKYIGNSLRRSAGDGGLPPETPIRCFSGFSANKVLGQFAMKSNCSNLPFTMGSGSNPSHLSNIVA